MNIREMKSQKFNAMLATKEIELQFRLNHVPHPNLVTLIRLPQVMGVKKVEFIDC